jgi:hypothetical protein
MCGYGGAWTRPDDFTSIDGVDLCKWCADPTVKQWLQCGHHTVVFATDSWSCTCGAEFRRPLLPSWVLAAVPSMLNATANAHVTA